MIWYGAHVGHAIISQNSLDSVRRWNVLSNHLDSITSITETCVHVCAACEVEDHIKLTSNPKLNSCVQTATNYTQPDSCQRYLKMDGVQMQLMYFCEILIAHCWKQTQILCWKQSFSMYIYCICAHVHTDSGISDTREATWGFLGLHSQRVVPSRLTCWQLLHHFTARTHPLPCIFAYQLQSLIFACLLLRYL